MSIEPTLIQRCDSKCELCSSTGHLSLFEVAPVVSDNVDKAVMLCETCRELIEASEISNVNHWHCLNETMWSQVPAVQVMAWRVLKRISSEVWAQDMLDMLYMEEDVKAWAEDDGVVVEERGFPDIFDSNKVLINAGDNVTLIKDLKVKGSSMVAKQGTVVRGIALTQNPEHIEGRIDGQKIVILSCYVKKS